MGFLRDLTGLLHSARNECGDGANIPFAADGGGGLVSALPGDNDKNVVKRVGFPGD